MAEFVINEVDIFKYAVSENVENTVGGSVSNAKYLINRIPLNIFTDEYFVMYEMLRAITAYDMAFSSDAFYQVVLNHKDVILNSDKVTLSEDVKNEDDRFEQIVTLVMAEYNELSDQELPEFAFKGNIELYLKSWSDERMEQIIYTMQVIATEGMKIGRETFKGTEQANYYYMRSWGVIKGILEGDSNLLSEMVDTSKQSPDEIKTQHDRNETSQEPLGFTNIGTLDKEMTGIYKGEMYTIQAGSGAGKSRMAVNMAKSVLNNGKNVLFISLEQKASRIFSLFQARHILDTTGNRSITDKNIIRGDYSAMDEGLIDESRIDLVENEKLGRIRIEGRYLKAIDVPMFLEEIWEDFKFDAVVLDYVGLLAIEKDRYNEITDCVNWLKNACKSFKDEGFALIIPNQLGKESEKELMRGNDDLAGIGGSESMYVFRASDVVLTLFADKDMKKDNEMDIFISKMRLGEAIDSIRVRADLGHCYFSDIERSAEESEEFFAYS